MYTLALLAILCASATALPVAIGEEKGSFFADRWAPQDAEGASVIKTSIDAMFGTFELDAQEPTDDDGSSTGFTRFCLSRGSLVFELAHESQIGLIGVRLTTAVNSTTYDTESGIGALSLGDCVLSTIPGYPDVFPPGTPCSTVLKLGACFYAAAVSSDGSSNAVAGIVVGGESDDDCELPIPADQQTAITQELAIGRILSPSTTDICPAGGGGSGNDPDSGNPGNPGNAGETAGIVIGVLTAVGVAAYAGLVFAGVLPRPTCGSRQTSAYSAISGASADLAPSYNGSTAPAVSGTAASA